MAKLYTIKVDIQPIGDTQHCIAWIEGEEYKATVVQGKSLVECLTELAISINIKDDYDNENR